MKSKEELRLNHLLSLKISPSYSALFR